MAKKMQLSTKRLAINKASSQMIGIVAAASIISIFCLVGAKAVLAQNSYRSHVITAKEKARDQLRDNIEAVDDLVSSYKGFVSTSSNVIGGTATGTGDKDGNNADIILDALPSNYDFPRLTSSVEKILTDRNFKISSIDGTDDAVNQQDKASSPKPKPQEMPFSFSVKNADYAAIQQLVATLQLSIRPIQIDSVDLSGASSDMQLTVKAHTYYQPEKNLTVTKKVVK